MEKCNLARCLSEEIRKDEKYVINIINGVLSEKQSYIKR